MNGKNYHGMKKTAWEKVTKDFNITVHIPNKIYYIENKNYHIGLKDWNRIPVTNMEKLPQNMKKVKFTYKNQNFKT